MTRHRTLDRTLRVAVCLIAALAAGCGGDDDSPPPPELLQITAGNQVAVAQATAANFGSLDSFRDIPISNGAGATAASGLAGTKHVLGKAIAASARSFPLGTISITEPCLFSGSIAITLDDRDNNAAPSAGDVLTSVFNDCRDTSSSSVTGSFAINIAGYSDSLLSGLFTFNQLALADPQGSVAVSGQANLVYTMTRDAAGTWTTRVDMKVPAAGLVSSITTPKYKETFTYDPDFSALWNDVMPTTAPGYSTSVLNGKLAFASLGKVLLATDPPFRDVWEEDGPSGGAALITGNQSRLRISVVNTTTARLELDANNDGTFESTRDIPWTELLPF